MYELRSKGSINWMHTKENLKRWCENRLLDSTYKQGWGYGPK